MEKITIQHFVNKNLNPRIENNKKKFPLYVQVITLRRHLRFKSNNKYFEYLSDDELSNEYVEKMLLSEKECLETIVRDLINCDRKDLITSKNLSFYSQNLFDIIDNKFCKLLQQESSEVKMFVPDILLSATYSDIDEIINFFGSESPISDISANVGLGLKTIQALNESMGKQTLYIYDLFFGSKKEIIEKELFNYTAGEDTGKMIASLQNTVQL